MNHETPAAEHGFDLAGILNILWRRRLFALGLPLLGLLVGVAYGIFGTRRWDALATVRPGITAYDPSGGPVRQWQLKDITRWYEMMLYRKELNQRLGLHPSAYNVIRAEFIATGMTNLAGGDIITLWTTATSPELAAALIDTSLVLFNEYAEADSVSSQIRLTEVGLQLKISDLENRRSAVDHTEAGLTLSLREARADSSRIAEKHLELEVDLRKLAKEIEYYTNRREEMVAERNSLEAEFAWLEEAGGGASGADLGYVAAARLQIRRAISRNAAYSDSLALAVDKISLEVERVRAIRPATIASEMRAAETKIGDLILQRDLDVGATRMELDLGITGYRSQLNQLAPLQRVGTTMVSDGPVRPRPLRATAILVFLGTLGGLVLAFVWDYVSAHRRRIFRA